MKPGREQVLGSFTLLAVTAILILIALPSRAPHDPVILEIPVAVEKPGTIAVEIAGESGRNGIYFIPRGTTVAAFLDMAGITAADGTGDLKRFGALRSATTVTLPPMFSGVSVGTMAADKRLALGIAIDINRATLEELVLIPGIGEKTAERIVEDRQLNGTFLKLEELTRVKGIKEKRLEKFRRYLCIGC
jgi:competence protein ComEA